MIILKNFSKNEIAVFNAISQLKFAKNVSVIARAAGIPRTTTLYILRRFEKEKIVSCMQRFSPREKKFTNRLIWKAKKRISAFEFKNRR